MIIRSRFLSRLSYSSLFWETILTLRFRVVTACGISDEPIGRNATPLPLVRTAIYFTESVICSRKERQVWSIYHVHWLWSPQDNECFFILFSCLHREFLLTCLSYIALGSSLVVGKEVTYLNLSVPSG